MIDQYISGVNYGWSDSVRVHKTALICGQTVRVGAHSRIDAYTVITGKVDIGERCHIGHCVSIHGTHGVTIRNGSTLSPGVHVFTMTDDINSPLLASPQAIERGGKTGPVYIGSCVVVGANSIVLPGTDIMDEANIASNSLVRGTVPMRTVWGGNPAKKLKARHPVDRAKATG